MAFKITWEVVRRVQNLLAAYEAFFSLKWTSLGLFWLSLLHVGPRTLVEGVDDGAVVFDSLVARDVVGSFDGLECSEEANVDRPCSEFEVVQPLDEEPLKPVEADSCVEIDCSSPDEWPTEEELTEGRELERSVSNSSQARFLFRSFVRLMSHEKEKAYSQLKERPL